MNSLNKYKKTLNNCSRCGLCQAVCPIFDITKNDGTSPKGKFILLNEILNNNEKPSKTLIKYMKTCLDCGKCLEYCPSKINIKEINKAFFESCPSLELNPLPKIEHLILKSGFKSYKENKDSVKLIREKLSEFSKEKKIVYLKNYEEETLPEIISNNKSITVYDCGASLKFKNNNPKLYTTLAETNARKILSENPDYIVTDNFLCLKEIENGFSNLEINKKIISLAEFLKKYLQV